MFCLSGDDFPLKSVTMNLSPTRSQPEAAALEPAGAQNLEALYEAWQILDHQSSGFPENPLGGSRS